ncbi:MAG TPA: glycogen synthase GlgA [Gemmataceae bacterium]|jgi:starch synthase|nr:glycogen synthase GlgA [Gemmataceae bacterium]
MSSQSPSFRVLLASSEAVPFAKTGGLADVAGSLPRALEQRGLSPAVILPLYRSARTGRTAVAPTDHYLQVPLGGRIIPARLWRSTLPDSRVPVWLIEQNDFFDRDDPGRQRGLYQFVDESGQKRDYPDNGQRFAFFCKAVLETCRSLDYWPDVLHANDWQTGLIPVFLREATPKQSRFRSIRTVFTLHNLAYQGVFPKTVFDQVGLPDWLFSMPYLEYYGQLNFLKAGIVFADWLNTVSPMYAKEIHQTNLGCGLQGVLTERRDRLSGIMNGIDYRVWNPATDERIAARYSPETISDGKSKCKAALQAELGLAPDPRAPLLAVIARLVEQKGIELILKAAETLLAQDVHLITLGEGDAKYQQQLRVLESRHPRSIKTIIGFDEDLAHRIEAGADIFLMPSVYEPSGLNQLYSLKYGTVPVVRVTGGLADTIVDTNEETLANGTATGFCFQAIAGWALRETVERALTVYRNRPKDWRQIQETGMRQDWSWNRSAAEYEKLYRRLVSGEW